MDQSSTPSGGLPENAYRELQSGEVYRPIIPAEAKVREISTRSIAFGLAMTCLFSAAASYLALKLGQGIESAIPISILAIGFSAILARRSTLLENLNIVVFGATAGIVVGGSVFVMPAIFILGLQDRSGFFQIFVVPFLGAALGALFLIPFRRYFVADMHGKLPFPEATATTEILVTGERGGRQAVILLYSMGIGIVLDYLALGVRAWSDLFTTALVPRLRMFTEDIKAVFALNTSSAVLGLGYIIGVRYASIICAGSFLSYFVLIPLFGKIGTLNTGEIMPGLPPLAGLPYDGIFRSYVRNIGIGGIFGAGVLSILRMSPVIVQAIGKVFGEIRRVRGGSGKDAAIPRTDLDIGIGRVGAMIAGLSLLIFLYFRFSVLAGTSGATGLAFVALLMTLGVSFLFAAVSAWAVAMISITPISGMTLTTLIVSAVILAQLGLSGPQGMLSVLLIGGVVCSALSMTGSMVTMFKIGYWVGGTPKRIQWSLIAGSALASITVTAVIMLFARTYGYVAGPTHANPMAAPQANAMAAVIGSVMASAQAPWFLYAVGAVIAVIVQMLGISALAFALGMYLPIELNTPLLFGAIVAWLVKRPSGDENLDRARGNRGTLIASGLIAGGALAGVVDGLFKFVEEEFVHGKIIPQCHFSEEFMNWAGLFVFVALGLFVYWDARKARAEEGAGPTITM